MYIESILNRSSEPAILLRENKRESGRIKDHILANPTDLWLKLLLREETTCRRIEADSISSEFQRRVFELLGNS